jgi:ankyrin repeat protein
LVELTAAGFGLEERGGAGGSALFAAVQWNRPDNVRWLTEHGADANAVDVSGASVLRHTLVCGNRDEIQHLLAAGARIDPGTRALAESKGIYLNERVRTKKSIDRGNER